jgi:hypothetical protein
MRINSRVFTVHETTSKLESRDLVDPIIYRCRKHRQLVHQEGRFLACFPPNVLMVHSSMLVITTDGELLTCGGFTLSETINFESLEFIADSFSSLNHSPKGSDLGIIFMGTARSRSPSLCLILEDSTNEFNTTSSREGSSYFPVTPHVMETLIKVINK